METAHTLSPLAALLFAAEQVAKPGRLDGIHIAGSDAKVSTGDLAPKLLAFAFLHLRDEGAISLQCASKKVLFVTTTWVQTMRTGTPTSQSGAVAALLNCVTNGKSVKDAVYAWYGQDVMNPWPVPIRAATQEAISTGYLQQTEQNIGGKIGSVFTGAVPTVIVSGKEAEVRAIADEAAKKWAAYAAQDAALLDLLVKQCSGGISARQEQQSSAADV